MRVEPAHFPAMGIDTTLTLDAAHCAALKAAGISFVCRYFGGLSVVEVKTIMDAGLALMPVTYCRKMGWVPTADLGHQDAVNHIGKAKLLGLPPGVTCWLDIEGCHGPAKPTQDFIDAWADDMKAAGYDPGVYIGYAPGGMSADDLWHTHVDRYWRAPFSLEPSNCGPCMFQLYPLDIKLAGVQVDVDVIQQDKLKRVPSWIVKA